MGQAHTTFGIPAASLDTSSKAQYVVLPITFSPRSASRWMPRNTATRQPRSHSLDADDSRKEVLFEHDTSSRLPVNDNVDVESSLKK